MQKHIFNIHDVILFMTLAECFLLVIFQTFLPLKNKLATRTLGLFLLAISLHSACILVLWNDEVGIFYLFDQYWLPYCLVTAEMAKGPLLFFYVLSLTKDSFAFKRQHFLHLLPLVVALIWLAVFNIDSLDLRYLAPDQSESEQEIVRMLWYFIKISPLCYSIAAVNQLRLYKIGLKNQYSTIPPTETSWLKILCLGFLIVWAFAVFVHLMASTLTLDYPRITDIFGITENYIVFILINALFINSLVNTHKLLTTGPDTIKEKTIEGPTSETIDKVTQAMEKQRLFLIHNLNIEELSRRVDLSIKEVSAVINIHYQTNFFEFINRFRVEEAKRLLCDASHAHLTVMDVLLESGFNSKSAFHRFFNRLVGMSPTEYRKKPS